MSRKKGFKHSEETKLKMRLTLLNRKYKPMSLEGRKNISKALKKLYKDKKNHPRYGKQHTLNTKKKISEAQKRNPNRYWKGKKFSTEHRRKLSLVNKGKKIPVETTKKRIETRRKNGWWKNPIITRKKIKESNLKTWNNIELRNKTLRKVLEAVYLKPNECEKYLDNILQKIFPNEFKFVGGGTFIMLGKCPDWISLKKKLIIYFFGERWHSKSEESIRKKHFSKFGYKTLIIWDSHKNDLVKKEEQIIKQIKNFVK